MGRTIRTLSCLTIILLGSAVFQHQKRVFSGTETSSRAASAGDTFDWEKIPSLKELKWLPCYPNRECARLLVPMNYSAPADESLEHHFSLALIRKPAEVPPDSELYRGPVLFNPGGPGGSGVDLLSGPTGDFLSAIVGVEFDVVSFDPRGIARSGPRASFFVTDTERAFWDMALATSNLSDVATTWARSRVAAQLAEENDGGALRHINTPNTARDMLRIVEAHGREKIQYWGFSYGTVLGATFAAMFPDKIERLVIDGVADSEDYYATLWSTALQDTENALNSFYIGCADAGPDGCAFWAPTPEDIHQNLTTLFDSVRHAPIPMRTDAGYGVLDINVLRLAVFVALYSPYALFVPLAQGLADLAAGSGKLIFDSVNPPRYECACGADGGSASTGVRDSQVAVQCNDGAEVPGDLKSAQKYFDLMTGVSHWGDILATISGLQCFGWPKFPKDPFRGPFVGNTSYPILLVGNTFDPITPLSSAKKMSKGFKDSVVLTQNSVGHCSISAPSLCTQKYIQDYFIDGTLPEPGTVCEPLIPPFPFSAGAKVGESDAQTVMSTSMTAKERSIVDAILELSRTAGVVKFPGLKAPVNQWLGF